MPDSLSATAASRWIDEAWSWIFIDPARSTAAAALATERARSEGDADGEAFGLFHTTLDTVMQGPPAQADAMLDALEARCAQLHSPRAQWSCDDARAMRLTQQGRLDEAIALGQRNDARAPDSRSAFERCFTLIVLDTACRAAGRFDQALRYGYRSVAMSSPLGQRWHAIALVNLASDHLSCLNFDDGLPLHDQAWQHMLALGATQRLEPMRSNLIFAYYGMHREDLAAGVLTGWQAAPGGITEAHERKYAVPLALAYLAAGQTDAAARCLARPPTQPPRDVHHGVARVWVQARLLAAQGRPAKALEVCRHYLASQGASDHVDTPFNRVQIHQMQRRCCEALGDWAGAHAAAQAAHLAGLPLVGLTAEARYLAVQIQHEVEHGHEQAQNAAVHLRRLDALERGVRRASQCDGGPSALTAQGDAWRAVESARLHERVNDILDLGRLDASQLGIEPHPFSLTSLLQDCVDRHADEAAAKGLALKVVVDASVPVELTGDSLRIRQVLDKLVANGVEFTHEGHVVLRARRTGERQGIGGVTLCRLRIEVVDSGPGLGDAQAELFVETVDARTGRPRLGLALCRRLVELMDGQIGAESLAGGGSLVWFQLDLAETLHAAPFTTARRRRA